MMPMNEDNMSLSRYKMHDLWVASLNGNYRGRIWLRDSFFILLYYFMSDQRDTSQKALDRIVSLLEQNGGRPAICYDSDLKPVSVHNFLTGKPADLQNDVMGAIIWIYGAAKNRAYKLGKRWSQAVNNIIDILYDEHYWEQPDSGMWEMEEDIRASSVGICVAGLRQLSGWSGCDHEKVDVLIQEGKKTLKYLLPQETETRKYDAALLSLIWPFRVVDNQMAMRLLSRISDNLVGSTGIKRFINDPYYNCDGQEAEWGLFIPQILLAMQSIGFYPLNEKYTEWKSIKKIKEFDYPESFICNNKAPNRNTPLAWTQAMCLMADHLLVMDRVIKNG